jgi:hypothetical protein
MSQMEIDHVVSQIRAMRAQVGGPMAQAIRPAGLGGMVPGPGGVAGRRSSSFTMAVSPSI